MLAPSPPRSMNAGMLVPWRQALDAAQAWKLSREEVAARKRLREEEAHCRADVEFLIAVGRSEYRHSGSAKYLTKDEVERVNAKLDLILFESPARRSVSPTGAARAVPRERRLGALKMRKPMSMVVELESEEAELRNWLGRIENKLREPIETDCINEYLSLTAMERLFAAESNERRVLLQTEEEQLISLRKVEFRARPFFRRPPPRRPLTFEETETAARELLCNEEAAERKAYHDELVLRYGVQLYSVARTEDIDRLDVFEEGLAALENVVKKFTRESYRYYVVGLTHAAAVIPQRQPLLLQCLNELCIVPPVAKT